MILLHCLLYALWVGLIHSQSTQTNVTSTAAIHCTWPCANSDDVCEINTSQVSCQPKKNQQWVIVEPERAPIYFGTLGLFPNATCQSVPIPNISISNTTIMNNSSTHLHNNSTPATTTVIQWPPVGIDFLSTCGPTFYCTLDTPSTCQFRHPLQSACTQSHECESGLCKDLICQSKIDKPAPKYALHKNEPAMMIVHVLAAVFGIIGALLVTWGIYMMFRRKRIHRNFQEKDIKETLPMPVMTQFDKFSIDFNHSPETSTPTPCTPPPALESIQVQVRQL
ncbi:hypothetical protein BDF14DRAFT_1853354 [Spinellus fusiger]|nr:hypothetical protein BDF14DRAFT_1853354 [Spinellus fusiger]